MSQTQNTRRTSSHPVFTAGGVTSKALKMALAGKVTP